jgi:hypothetical protein
MELPEDFSVGDVNVCFGIQPGYTAPVAKFIGPMGQTYGTFVFNSNAHPDAMDCAARGIAQVLERVN